NPITQEAPDSWPTPDFSPNAEQVTAALNVTPESFPDSPFEIATAAPEVVQQPEAVFEPQVPSLVEPMAWSSPIESPFQIAPEPPTFISVPESPAFSAVEYQPSIYGSPQATSFEPAPLPDATADAFQVAEPPAQSAVADTDRVDDLLRQFRERYGRGNL
ncbi:MAG: hypothetical protein H8M99_07795, partial [Gloeobacteraceae cyanobacterium ES-bin-144]|nr:hypothetical protein [Verrucomicrobiales bacterium]